MTTVQTQTNHIAPRVSVDVFAPVREDLRRVETRLAESMPFEHEALQQASAHLLAAGGKRVRPAVSLLVAGMFETPLDKAITFGAAVEMLHTATLVHDDLIDGSLLRRGMATINANWSPAATVLTGDFLFARAAGLAAQTGSVRVMEIFARTLAVLVNGEIEQLFEGRAKLSREDYYTRIYAKTASMFELACEAAAVLGGASEREIQALATFGREIGKAFQIVDDVLDYVGTPETLGKPAGGDLLRGLVTLPALYYIEANPTDPDMLALLDGKLGNPLLTAKVVAAVRESEAVAQAVNEARMIAARGVAALDGFPESEEKAALVALADYFVSRHF